MANYFDFMQNIKNPFTGAIDAITDPVDEGGINIFGAGVNKEFEAMKTAGLLTDQQYKDAVEQADIRSKRSGIIQGLLGFGLQNFDKGYGSAFDPRYLKRGLAAAIPAAQKPFDKLSSNVMNIETLKTFKAAKDKEVSRLAMIKDFQSGKYGTVEDGTFTKEEMALFPQLGIAQMYDMIKPKIPVALSFQNVVGRDNKTQKYQVPKGPFGDDKDGDGVPDNWMPVGESYISREQRDIPTAPKSLLNSTIFRISKGAIGFEPSVETIYPAASDVSAVAEQLGEIARKSGNPINDSEKMNKAIEYLKESGALVEGRGFSKDSYDSKTFLNYVDEQIDKSKTTSSETKNSFKEEIFEIKGKKYKTLPNSDKLIEVI